jgi:hypothetical protein
MRVSSRALPSEGAEVMEELDERIALSSSAANDEGSGNARGLTRPRPPPALWLWL